jgi:twitching motility protein PilU
MDITPFFKMMVDKEASDIFFSVGAPVSIKVQGQIQPLANAVLQPGSVTEIANQLMNDEQIAEFKQTLEMNVGKTIEGVGRFRVNIFLQRGECAVVARHIKTSISTVQQLGMPDILNDLIMEPRGLILVSGATGVGKTTTMAAMLNYRNKNRNNHILTVEDPIEYLFVNDQSIVNQREVGIDTKTFESALQNAMREAPDVILIGEIRSRETMEHALAYADSGHLVMSTVHANNADQTMDRMLNFFPKEVREHVLMDIALNLKAVISQRLVMGKDGKRLPAAEIMINTPYIADLILKGEMKEIKAAMSEGQDANLQTFDHALYKLYQAGKITDEEALKHADSRNDLKLKMRFSGSDDSAFGM